MLEARLVPSTDGVHIALHDLGGSGPPMLFAHGTGLLGMVWRPLARFLAKGHRCWAIDLRGHGDAVTPPAESFAWEGFGRDVLAALDDLNQQPVVGVGHSMGAAAMVMAELERPGSFAALVLHEPGLFPADSAETPGRTAMIESTRRRRTSFPSRADAHRRYASKAPFGSFMPDALDAYIHHGLADAPDGSVVLKCKREHETRVFEMSRRHGTFERLGHLQLPVLVLGSPPLDLLPSGMAPLVAAAVPGARYEPLAGTGHFGPFEAPALIGDRIDRFLESIPELEQSR